MFSIFSDSACDLPQDFFQKEGVTLIPLQIEFNDASYTDLVDIQPKEIYDALRQGAVVRTSQPSPTTFAEAFRKAALKKEEVLCLTLSSVLSGTHQSAQLALQEVLDEYPDFRCELIDTKCASLGYGILVQEAVARAKNGSSLAETADDIRFRMAHMEHLFTVDSLETLMRGGRVSKASAFVGGLLNIKPLLHVENGALVPLEKTRGNKKWKKRMLELMAERGDRLQDQVIGISHGDHEELALEMKELIQAQFGCKTFVTSLVGGAIGAHAGPGTLAIFFLNEYKPSLLVE